MKTHKVVIVGGGITAAYIAESLLNFPSYEVSIVEARGVASGASSNVFSSYRIVHKSPRISELAFHAYHAYRVYIAV